MGCLRLEILENHKPILGKIGKKMPARKVRIHLILRTKKEKGNYYPFGMEMVGRNGNVGNYRYGYNSHEKDDEVAGAGNHLSWGDYGYDSRIGRRWNLDPKWNEIPNQSPYSINNNNPVQYKDPDGKFGILGAAIGAFAGAVGELASQMVSNVIRGEPALRKLDWGDVLVSAGEGAIVGSGAGMITIIASKTVGAVTKSAIDISSEKGIETVGGKKSWNNAWIDLASNMIGNSIGRFSISEVISDKIINKSSKFITNLFGKTIGAIPEEVIKGSVNGGIKKATEPDHFLLNEITIEAKKTSKGGVIKDSPSKIMDKIEKANP